MSISRLCLGTMMFGGATSQPDAERIIGRAFEAGIQFIDTADIYNDGRAEEIVGAAIKDRRHDWVLASKGGRPIGRGPNERGNSRKHIIRACEDSLRRLGTDRIDLFYLHSPDDVTPIEESVRALDDLHRAGKILYSGFSNVPAWQLCAAEAHAKGLGVGGVAATQPTYNLLNRDIEVELLPLCRAAGIGAITYSPLARGVLTGKYAAGGAFPPDSRAGRGDKRILQTELRAASLESVEVLREHCRQRNIALSQFSLAWVLRNRLVASTILGPRTLEQFEDNLAAMDLVLSDADEIVVDQLVPPGEHAGRGYRDPQYALNGRDLGARTTHPS